jgi:hypothetical protein
MTYLIASFEARSLDTGLLVGDDADSGGVHVSEDILDFTDEDLSLSVDHTGKEGDLGLVDESDDLVFTDVREVGNFLDVSGRALVEASSESTAASSSATTESTATSTATSVSASTSAESASASWFKSHI